MFCIGLAPTLPGIKLRFSMPPKPLSIQFNTNSCQFSPAPDSTITSLAVSSITSNLLISFFITSPSKSFVRSKLLPPPKTSSFLSSLKLKICFSSSIDENTANISAFTDIPKVLYSLRFLFV